MHISNFRRTFEEIQSWTVEVVRGQKNMDVVSFDMNYRSKLWELRGKLSILVPNKFIYVDTPSAGRLDAIHF